MEEQDSAVMEYSPYINIYGYEYLKLIINKLISDQFFLEF
jgi:hypothetical protein